MTVRCARYVFFKNLLFIIHFMVGLDDMFQILVASSLPH